MKKILNKNFLRTLHGTVAPLFVLASVFSDRYQKETQMLVPDSQDFSIIPACDIIFS
jgi:hypothetical protein